MVKIHFLPNFYCICICFTDTLVDDDVTDSVPAFIEVYKTAADNMLFNPNASNSKKYVRTQPQWWNIECTRAKHTKFQLLRQFRVSNDMADLQLYKNSRNIFKSLCRKCKSSYERTNRNNLVNARKSPKEFWKLIKKSNSKSPTDENQVT